MFPSFFERKQKGLLVKLRFGEYALAGLKRRLGGPDLSQNLGEKNRKMRSKYPPTPPQKRKWAANPQIWAANPPKWEPNFFFKKISQGEKPPKIRKKKFPGTKYLGTFGPPPTEKTEKIGKIKGTLVRKVPGNPRSQEFVFFLGGFSAP